MRCPCHGSQFRADGTVLSGLANEPLRRLDYTQVDGVLEIRLPDVFYEIKIERVESASRVHLSFLGFLNLTYEVYFRSSLDGLLERASFSTTPGGPLSQTELPGADDYAHVYLERPGTAGFFQVTMKTAAV
jgi:hypothetical protein